MTPLWCMEWGRGGVGKCGALRWLVLRVAEILRGNMKEDFIVVREVGERRCVGRCVGRCGRIRLTVRT